MNILENVKFEDKASVAMIRKDEKLKYFAVGLGENGVLAKHTAPVPSTLVVAKGEINFVFSDRNYILKELDTFEIPVGEEHEVIGLKKENLFFVSQVF